MEVVDVFILLQLPSVFKENDVDEERGSKE
jgi:hypothetical protein